MSKYERVKGYYEAGLWDLKRVKNAVLKKWITASEYAEITGSEYEVGD